MFYMKPKPKKYSKPERDAMIMALVSSTRSIKKVESPQIFDPYQSTIDLIRAVEGLKVS